MLRFKKFREIFGGFPTRCVGCLLAVIIFFAPCFSAYALNFTNDSYPFDINDIPDFSSYYTLSLQYGHNVWLCYSPSNQLVYYISWHSPSQVPSTTYSPCQFFANFDTNSSQYNRIYFYISSFSDKFVENPSHAFVEYAPLGSNSQWIDGNITDYTNAYSVRALWYQLPNDAVLLACNMQPYYEDNNDNQYFSYYGNFSIDYFVVTLSIRLGMPTLEPKSPQEVLPK